MYNLAKVDYSFGEVIPFGEKTNGGGRVTGLAELAQADNKEVRLANRSMIEQFEEAIKTHLHESDEAAEEARKDHNEKYMIEHRIDDTYIRELFIPANKVVVSKLWDRERLWIIAKGKLTLKLETGDLEVEGPFVYQPPFGSKVAAYTHTDTLWFAIAGDVTSEFPEDEVTVKDYQELSYPWDKLEYKETE